MTAMPTFRSPPVISVMCPSLMPGVTATATGTPSSGSTHTSLAAAVLAPDADWGKALATLVVGVYTEANRANTTPTASSEDDA